MLCSHVVTLKTAPLPSMDTPNKKSPTHISSVKYFFSVSCQNGMPQNDYFHCCNGICVSVLRKCWSLLYVWITLNKRSSVRDYNVKKMKGNSWFCVFCGQIWFDSFFEMLGIFENFWWRCEKRCMWMNFAIYLIMCGF